MPRLAHMFWLIHEQQHMHQKDTQSLQQEWTKPESNDETLCLWGANNGFPEENTEETKLRNVSIKNKKIKINDKHYWEGIKEEKRVWRGKKL